MVNDILDWLQSLPPAGLVAAAGLLVFGETTLGLGFIAPGETGLFILGTTVANPSGFLLMWLVTTACAIAGDSLGYFIGWKFGPRLRQTKVIRKHGAESWDKATGVLRRRGAYAVVIGIFLPVLRTLMPASAGAAGLPLRKFIPAMVVAAMAWCALHIGVGMAAGDAARRIENAIGAGSWIVLGVIVAAAVTVVLVKRKRTAGDDKQDAA
ncbi:DedA family protein [Saccharomonospora sp. NPDC006951]